MSIRELDYEQSLLYNEVRSATDIASKKSSSVANNSRQFFLNSSHLISTGPTCNDIDVIVLFTSGPHLRHNYHGNKTLETMLSGSVEFVGHRLNRPVLLHLCVSCSSYKQRHTTCQHTMQADLVFLKHI